MSDGHPELLARDARQQARHGALLFAAASLVTVVALVLPHQPEVDELGLVVVAIGSGAAALGMRLGDHRLAPWAYQLFFAWGTLLISLALLFNGERNGGPAGGDELFYLWVVLYAAYYFDRRAVAIQVLLVAAAYAATLTLIDPGPIAVSRWVTMAGLVVGTAVVVRLLSERVTRLIQALDSAARTDPLTGLANRRGFEEQFARDIARVRRDGRPLALLLADVDAFKAINDRWGHTCGDAALAGVGAALRGVLRTVDTPARIGGDEFAVLLPDADADGARLVAARLAEAVRTQCEDPAVALSIGFAVAEQDTGSLEELMRVADMALYAVKQPAAPRGPDPDASRDAPRPRVASSPTLP